MSIVPKLLSSRIKCGITEGLEETDRLLKGSPNATPIVVERYEQMFYINFLREGMIAFDVGANVGELSLLFSRFIRPGGKVFSFEASAAAFDKLTAIYKLSGRDNIEMYHMALSDSIGTVEINIYPDEYSKLNTLADRPLSLYGVDVKPIKREQVRSSTIDIFCEERSIKHIDLLKIDVEGAEYQVLKGARHMLEQKRVGCCVFEFGATTFDMGNSPEMIESYLAQVGYRIRNIVPGNPCFPGRKSAMASEYAMHVAEPK